jgi:uncharacterized protein YbjT (DUF2867 family)
MKTLLLLGATGLVGQQVLQLALGHPEVARVVAPVRRALPPRPRLEAVAVDFDHLPADAPWWHADAAICTLGTTLKLAGSKDAFRRVDHDYVLTAASLARRGGTRVFALNSSLGAAVDGGSFYLRVKGDTERDLAVLGFASLTFVRPSLLEGGPRPDARPAEAVALLVARWLRPLIPRRYRAVSTGAVARALLEAALAARPGVHAIESEALQA